MNGYRVLIVDDEEIVRDALTEWLENLGYQAKAVEDGFKAIEVVENSEWDVLLVDLKMPKMDGIETLRRIRKIKPDLPIIIITGHGTVDSAVIAMKEGAADYVMKPFNPEEINIILKKLLEHQEIVKENILLRKELEKRFKLEDLIGKSTKMQKVFELIKTVAPTRSTVLILGESGTGKELVARAIHNLSPRSKGPFIAVACGAMPETLLEAELFGYEKGAFTGAFTQHKGRIEMSDQGTLFLDEIGDISMKTQVDLLRFLQEREFRRIGGKEVIKVDARIIAATNKNLEDMIKNGSFREDLYYRLNVITIEIPPLRERKEDIPLLVEHFLKKFNLENRKEITSVSPDVMERLLEYDWPGNVRELENVIEHAVVVSKGTTVHLRDLPRNLIEKFFMRHRITTKDLRLEAVEKEHILNVLKMCEWNIKRAAMLLGINRVTLYNKMEKYGLKRRENS
ncbi:MAG: sigma-54 dependent transcriptional regulator [candidate division WOR-3 bacterium]|nr:sigma-54 dependent transcriptional regulator [candidate division WOR-3 bacterium]